MHAVADVTFIETCVNGGETGWSLSLDGSMLCGGPEFGFWKTDLAVEKPGHADQVIDASNGPVPIGVFRYPLRSRPVIDWHFCNLQSGFLENGWQVAVEPVEWDQKFNTWTRERF